MSPVCGECGVPATVDPTVAGLAPICEACARAETPICLWCSTAPASYAHSPYCSAECGCAAERDSEED